MAVFNTAYQLTMSHEGSYSNDPRDHGGETWKGIARKMHPSWSGWQLIDSIKKNTNKTALSAALNADAQLEDLVKMFYRSIYWDNLRLNEIFEQEIANEIFDTAVNQGAGTAAKFFQQALNLLNNNQKHYSDLNVDGGLGNNTIKAYKAYMLTSNFLGRSVQRNLNTLLKAMNLFQGKRYVEICEKNPDQETFFYGWLNRV